MEHGVAWPSQRSTDRVAQLVTGCMFDRAMMIRLAILWEEAHGELEWRARKRFPEGAILDYSSLDPTADAFVYRLFGDGRVDEWVAKDGFMALHAGTMGVRDLQARADMAWERVVERCDRTGFPVR